MRDNGEEVATCTILVATCLSKVNKLSKHESLQAERRIQRNSPLTELQMRPSEEMSVRYGKMVLHTLHRLKGRYSIFRPVGHDCEAEKERPRTPW